MKKGLETTDSKFFRTLNKSALAMNQAAAGAGLTGLLGFAALFALASVFFVTESYFIAMWIVSIALLVYVTGAEVTKLFMSSMTIVFSSRHLTPRAVQLQETLVALQDALELRRDRTGEVRVAPLEPGAVITLPDNALGHELQAVLEYKREFDYAEYVAHAYYVECHEVYDSASSHLEFVSGAMPLFGLIGTILGLIAMFDSLGSNVSVESLSPQLALALKTTLYGAVFSSLYKILGTRFEHRTKSLDLDFETFCRALAVMVESGAKVKVGR